MSRLHSFLALVVTVFALLGCERAPLPQLIEVSDMVPHEVEAGDRLEFSGAQFPMGKEANLTFRGSLYRPGESPTTNAVVNARGTVVSPSRIELPFSHELMGKFAEIGEDANHTTFIGEVDVAFASLAHGAPPLVATLKDVTLDVRPPENDEKAFAKHRDEGLDLLHFLGIELGSGEGIGLVVENVSPGSRADLAGVRKGDAIVSFDHVRVAAPSDVRAGSTREARIGVIHEGAGREESIRIYVDGFRDVVPRDVLAAALLLGTMMLTMLLFLAPSRGVMSRVEALTAWKVKNFAAAGEEGVGRGFSVRFLRRFTLHLERPIFVGLSAVISAFIASVAYGPGFSLDTVDVALLFSLYAATCSMIASTGRGGARVRFASAGKALLAHATLPAAIAAVVSLTGTLNLAHIVRAQGGLPWQTHAFRSPPLFAAFILVLMGQMFAIDREPERHEVARLARFPLLLLGCAMIVAVFLGGWMVPGYEHVDAPRTSIRLLGAVLFVAKSWALAGTLAAAHRFVPGFSTISVSRVSLKWLVPLSVVAFAAAIGWSRLHLARSLETSVAALLFAFTILVALRFVERVILAFRSADVRATPFI